MSIISADDESKLGINYNEIENNPSLKEDSDLISNFCIGKKQSSEVTRLQQSPAYLKTRLQSD